jgi:hypothetical protein
MAQSAGVKVEALATGRRREAAAGDDAEALVRRLQAWLGEDEEAGAAASSRSARLAPGGAHVLAAAPSRAELLLLCRGHSARAALQWLCDNVRPAAYVACVRANAALELLAGATEQEQAAVGRAAASAVRAAFAAGHEDPELMASAEPHDELSLFGDRGGLEQGEEDGDEEGAAWRAAAAAESDQLSHRVAALRAERDTLLASLDAAARAERAAEGKAARLGDALARSAARAAARRAAARRAEALASALRVPGGRLAALQADADARRLRYAAALDAALEPQSVGSANAAVEDDAHGNRRQQQQEQRHLQTVAERLRGELGEAVFAVLEERAEQRALDARIRPLLQAASITTADQQRRRADLERAAMAAAAREAGRQAQGLQGADEQVAAAVSRAALSRLELERAVAESERALEEARILLGAATASLASGDKAAQLLPGLALRQREAAGTALGEAGLLLAALAEQPPRPFEEQGPGQEGEEQSQGEVESVDRPSAASQPRQLEWRERVADEARLVNASKLASLEASRDQFDPVVAARAGKDAARCRHALQLALQRVGRAPDGAELLRAARRALRDADHALLEWWERPGLSARDGLPAAAHR